MARAAPGSSGDAVARFESMYRACYADVLRYALRRSVRPEAAADVVAETFLVAWRRIWEVPDDRARLWLFGVARNVLANHHRSAQRHDRLTARLRHELTGTEVVQRDVPDDLAGAFRSLPDADQELLRLVAWEELSAVEIARVLSCSPNAVRIRLHRARKRLAAALSEPFEDPIDFRRRHASF